VRAREHPTLAGPRVWTALLLALAFASGEYAYFVLGYVAAYELIGARKPSYPSALAALGLAALVSGVGASLGYGIAYSGYYVSPLHDPARFAHAAIDRLPALVLDLTLGIPARYVEGGVPVRELLLERGLVDALTWHNLPSYRAVASVVVWPVLLVLYRVVRALVRRDESLRPLAWVTLGACFALVPAAGALPSPRLIGGSAVGVAALLAAVLTQVGSAQVQRAALPGSRVRAWQTAGSLSILLAITSVHGLLPAQRAHDDARYAPERSRTARNWALQAEIPAELPDDAQVWLTSASDFTTAVHVPWVRWLAGMPLIDKFHLLSGASRAHDLIRIDDRTLEVQVLASDPGRAFTGSLHRPETAPFADGAQRTDRSMIPQAYCCVPSLPAASAARCRTSASSCDCRAHPCRGAIRT